MRREIAYTVNERGCWICTSHSRSPAGYPVCKRGPKGCKARTLGRWLYEQKHGPLERGVVLRHTCDTPACINVAHLIPGSHAQNVADRVARGRSAVGERNGRARLREAQVVEILAQPHVGSCVLGKRYGIDAKVIRDIRRGKVWRCVSLPFLATHRPVQLRLDLQVAP